MIHPESAQCEVHDLKSEIFLLREALEVSQRRAMELQVKTIHADSNERIVSALRNLLNELGVPEFDTNRS
jgi:hypothetical protein